jgi:PGF-CTERM protein/uncharacterized repeat protein (TIGR01451 family)
MRTNFGVLVAIIMLAVMPAGVGAQIDEGLVAEWHFDDGSGNVLKDSSGNGNDGVIYGATWIDGKYGKALQFDGVDDYVDLSSIPSQTYPLSIEMWTKPDTTTPVGLFDSAPGQRYVIRNYLAGYIDWWNADPQVTLNLVADEWAHLVFIFWYDGNRHIDYYKNGVLQTSATGSTNSALAWTTFRLGNINSGTAGWYDGLIDEVRIYNRALSPEEIDSHYEQGPTALSLTKTATPNSIKQGQTTTITLTVKNTGITEIKDIEIADTIPQDLTFIDGETSKSYISLAPKDSRQFQYVLQFDEAGTFNLAPATASYADDEGNYKTVKSKQASVEVIPSLVSNSAQKPSAKSDVNAQSASVNLHGEKTDVALGEDVLLKLSAVNIIGNPTMHVQVIIIPPSGWSVTSSEFAKSGAGQYTTTYELESGGGKDIEVRIVPNQIGDDFQVEGRIIYYFGDDLATREDHTLNLPIKVRAEPDDGGKPSADLEESKTPGFGVLVAVIGLLVTAYLVRRK